MKIGSRMVFVITDWISNASRVFTQADVNKYLPDLKCYKITSYLVKHTVCQIVAR